MICMGILLDYRCVCVCNNNNYFLPGGAVGGVTGFYSGLRETKELTGAIKRTQ